MKKKLVVLLAIVLVLFTLSAVACEDVHTHDYVEVAAKTPTCTQKGNALYYTCTGCSQLFDADKKPIDAIPEIDAGHTYVEHTACEAKCEQAGNPLYYTCANCNVIFDADKKVIEKNPEIAALGHDYVNHAAVSANCTEGGNDEYYTCKNCSVIFDADKKVIDKVPTTTALGHDYVNHAVVSANCTEGGNDEYYTCKNCSVIFDASKKVIEAIPTTDAKGHTYTWSSDSELGVSTLKCHCGDVKGSVKVKLADSERVLIDVDNINLDMSVILAKFGEGITLKSITLGENTITDLTTIETVIKQLPHGDHDVTLAVAIGDSVTTDVTLPIRLAHTISTVDELKALYTVTDHETYSNPTVGGTLNAEGNGIATVDWYVLTADIDGANRLGGTTEYGNSDESWYTSGRYVQGFIGVFDGQGHTIKNFKIIGHGFFGHVGRGTIKNVNFDNITLADGDTCLIGKLVDSTIENVEVSNITIGTLSVNSGILGYHQFFSATLKDVDIDLTGVTTATNVFVKENTTAEGFDATSFENVTVKLDSTSGIKLFANTSATDTLDGVTVSFVPFTVEIPTANTEEFYYTGSAQTYTLATSDWYTISGNVQTEVGTHTVTVSLRKLAGITWTDGTTEDKTFTFEIKAFTDDMVKTYADAFVAKVTALGTPVYPRDIAAIQSVLADYNALHERVKAHESVVTAKATLDNYKTECDKWEELTYTYGTDHIVNAFSGYDSYYLVIYNPTDADAKFYYAGNADSWAGTGNTTLSANSWTQVVYTDAFASAGGAYCYVNDDKGKTLGIAGNGWILKIYGKKVASGTVTVALSVGGTVDAEIEGGGSLKVLSVTVLAGQQYLDGWGHMTADQIDKLKKYSNVYVYIYNPLETDVAFYLQDENVWAGHCRTTLKAQSWTKVTLDLSTIPAGYGVFVDVEYKPESNSTGWMISDFYGTAE